MQNAVVRRVDNALGLLLELPASPAATGETAVDSEPAPTAVLPANGKQKGKGKKGKNPGGGPAAAAAEAAQAAAAPAGQGTSAAGYAHISALSDERVEKLDKVTHLILH